MAAVRCRLASFPPGLRLSTLRPPLSTRYASQWSRRHANTFPSFFTRSPIHRFSVGRTAFWLIPGFGGLALYLYPHPQSLSSSIFSSSTLIPCRPPSASSAECVTPTIFSPLEEADGAMSTRILALLRDRIWEPILTAKRFIYLFALFMPVIICSPMLLVGNPIKKYHGDRWGAVWWYDFLVRRMEAAGPTFIKVRIYYTVVVVIAYQRLS